MGQYYKPVILAGNKKTVVKWFYSHEYDSGLKLMEHSWMKNEFVGAVERYLTENPQHIVWAGDYAEPCEGLKTNVYHRCTEKIKVSPKEYAPQVVKQKYIVNHTTKEFIDKSKVPSINGWRIHPLPLMTCEGNGQGGGDFGGEDLNKLVGTWARHRISIENKAPKGFKEVFFNLVKD